MRPEDAPRTKIIATIGPATNSPEMLDRLIRGGMDIARLNMSHATAEQTRADVANLRRLAAEQDVAIGILMDLQGPAIRTGTLPTPLHLVPGQRIGLTVRGATSEEQVSVDVNYDHLVDDISVGDVVVVDNGNLEFRVLTKRENQLSCEVLTAGVLGNRRHINLPGVRVNLPALTDKDRASVQLGIELGVDFFAMSFCREAKDVRELRGLLDAAGAPQKIVAKIENQQGVDNLEAIITEADGIMVARGDLGIEVPFEELPIIQREAVAQCRRRGCPVIVATHMLESMITNPSPTRAEITDVANAVYERADAIMLSGETSVGRYPEKCLNIMNRIAKRIECSKDMPALEDWRAETTGAKLMKAAVLLAGELEARALVVFTERGTMPRHAAWYRPLHTPIYAFTNNAALLPQLVLHWGTVPYLIAFAPEDPLQNVDTAIKILREKGLVVAGDQVVVATEIREREHLVEAVLARVVE